MSAPQWKYIMVHHSAGHDTAGVELDSIRDYHVNTKRWADAGYHFICEKVGKTYQTLVGRPLTSNGAHCPGMNDKAIGVCLVGDFTKNPAPDVQIKEAGRHIGALLFAFDLEPEAIVPHRDYRATECPGDALDLERIRDLSAETRAAMFEVAEKRRD